MRKFVYTICYLLSIQLLGLLFLTLFRVVEFSALHSMIGTTAEADAPSLLLPFLYGLWFDNVMASYLMALPLLLLLLFALFGVYSKWLRRGASVWFATLYPFLFLASVANIPYFQNFVKNINSGVLEWMDHGETTAGMVVQDVSFLAYFFLFLVSAVLFSLLLSVLRRWFTKRINAVSPTPFSWRDKGIQVGLTVLLLALCFLGIRGRLGTTPIRTSAVYYCNDPFLNQLGINPAFNFIYSVKEDGKAANATIGLMEDSLALAYARDVYRLQGDSVSDKPLLRAVKTAGEVQRKNVVLIFMESMSANFLQYFGQEERITPTLDSLYHQSLAFSNFYSAGIHTNQGVTAVLYSFPALMKRNMMKGVVPKTFTGIPSVLAENGWETMIFIPHEAQYDNMNAFLRNNGMHLVYDQADYPREEWVNNFGVPDHYLFEFSLPELDKHAQQGKPFFATILTVSNHKPFFIPEWFKPKSQDPWHQEVEYADWCIGNFLREAKQRDWYDNTVFVLVADHGILVDNNIDAELPQSYNHIAMLMFGSGIEPQIYEGLGLQEDIMPTLLGMLNVPYSFDGFGVDLMRTRRARVFYVADDLIAGRSDSAVCVYNHSLGKSYAYDVLPHWGLKPSTDSARTDSLKRYATALTQTAQWMFLNR